MDSIYTKRGDRWVDGYRWGNRLIAVPALVLVTVVLAATIARIILFWQTPGPFDAANQGLCDFHNGIYYPAQALLSGVSPYGQDYANNYPVPRQIPFFSPGILVLHAPLGLLPLTVAEVIYTVLNIGLLVAIAGLAAAIAGFGKRIDVIAAILLALCLSRAGHVTLFNGYFTFELVLATFLAIHWGKQSPRKAAVALMIVSAKPTYILPLGFLLLARGNYRALIYGAILSVLFAVIPFTWLAVHQDTDSLMAGMQNLIEQIVATQSVHRNQVDESPMLSWTRLDLLAVMAKWGNFDPGAFFYLASMLAMLVVPMGLLQWRAQNRIDDGVGGMTGALILTASLVSVYHQSYDALLVVVPLACMLLGRHPGWNWLPFWSRTLLAALLAIPAYNLLSTRAFLLAWTTENHWMKLATSISGVSLGLALALLCVLCWVQPQRDYHPALRHAAA